MAEQRVYVILASKPGEFRTEAGDGLQAVESWDYRFHGRLKGRYVIAELLREVKITIIDETAPPVVNRIPSKFLPQFDSVDAARDELKQLARGPSAELLKLSSPNREPPTQPMISVTFITNANKTVMAPADSNLLRVSLREKGGIPFKCGGGICGTCKCRIESGLEHTDAIKDKERKHLTDADFADGYRMACQTFINGDVRVSWNLRSVPQAEARPSRPASP